MPGRTTFVSRIGFDLPKKMDLEMVGSFEDCAKAVLINRTIGKTWKIIKF
jgi:hypothetical protein